MGRDALLLSIHPQFASKIMDGSKKVELRKVRPDIQKGSLLIIYVTAPVKAIIGTAIVEDIVMESPSKLWNMVKNSAGITQSQFRDYYKGANKGFGIICTNPQVLNQPVDLVSLRTRWQNFWPPQVYRYLTYKDLSGILDEEIST